jgi:hypothetical protein
MIVIEKDNIMATICEATQIDIKGILMIKVPKKQNKKVTMEEKREKMIDNLIMKKYPKNFN